MKTLEIKNVKAADHITSVAMRTFISSLNSGDEMKVAMLKASIARDLQNIEDIEMGLPALAAGEFQSVVPGDWDGLATSSCCEYISGSGTRYLICPSFGVEVWARIRTEYTRSEL